MATKTPVQIVLFLSFVLITPHAASAATINFGSLSEPGTLWEEFGSSLTFDGFVFTSSYGLGGPGLIVWQAGTSFHPVGGDPATSLMEYTAGHTTTITRSGGGVFALNGIDLANYGPGFCCTFQVKFTGNKSDTTIVSQTFTVNNQVASPELQSFAFIGFTDLVNVTMTQGTFAAGTAFQFNNLVVDSPVTAVPEPATMTLIASGFAALGGFWPVFRRRRD